MSAAELQHILDLIELRVQLALGAGACVGFAVGIVCCLLAKPVASMFAWRIVAETSCWVLLRNTITGRHRAAKIVSGWSPCPWSIGRDGQVDFGRGHDELPIGGSSVRPKA